jgi:hypothetical protein
MLRSMSFAHLLEDINQHKQEQEQKDISAASLSKQVSRMGSIDSSTNLGHNHEDRGRVGSICSSEDMSPLPTNIETKQEGTVKWHVYLDYLRAGAGVILGFMLIAIIFSCQQAASLSSNWWLAKWSNAESHRHRNYGNCSKIDDAETNRIRTMSEDQWNTYRLGYFHTNCSK